MPEVTGLSEASARYEGGDMRVTRYMEDTALQQILF